MTLTYNSDQEYIDLLCTAVADALAPWRSGEVKLWVTDHFNKWPEISIEISLMPGFVFVGSYNPWEPLDDEFLRLAHKAHDFYFYRPRIEPEDHIVLGEE